MEWKYIIRGVSAIQFWQNARRYEAEESCRRDSALLIGGDTSLDRRLFASELLQHWRGTIPKDFHMCAKGSLVQDFAARHNLGLPLVVHSSKNDSRRTELLTTCTKRLPGMTVVHIEQGIFVLSPEYALADMAASCDPLFTLSTGCMLSSQYVVTTANRLLSAPPVLDPDAFAQIASSLGSAHGGEAAKRVTPFILHGARSPMELKLGLVLTLPSRWGGYALPAPVLNGHVILPADARKRHGRKTYECDLLWQDKKLALFYDSNSEHLRPHQLSNDARRNEILKECGLEVITITNDQFRDLFYMDAIATHIGKVLGKRTRSRLQDLYARKIRLRNALDRINW